MSSKHSIQGKVVLIAGGAKNLGGLLARDLAAHGARAVAIHYHSAASRADAEATVAAVRQAGAQAVALQGELSRAGAMEQLFADAVAAVGRPDIAINTVGKVLKKPILDISEAEYDEMSDVNAKTAFFFLKEAGRHVQDHGKNKSAAALSPHSRTGLTEIEDVVPFIRHLVSDGWWITGQTILINGGYTTK